MAPVTTISDSILEPSSGWLQLADCSKPASLPVLAFVHPAKLSVYIHHSGGKESVKRNWKRFKKFFEHSGHLRERRLFCSGSLKEFEESPSEATTSTVLHEN
jgi:hypothetical protein